MKQSLFILAFLMSFQLHASEQVVPKIDPVKWFSEQKPLSNKDSEALEKSNNWINDKQYPFKDGNKVIYLYEGGQSSLVCAPLKLCLIELEPGERIVQGGLHLGDKSRWKITPTVGVDKSTFLIIKPVDAGLETTLVVITDKRVYHLRLISRKDDYMPIVSFEYESSMNAEWEAYYAKTKQERLQQEQQQQRETIPTTNENISDLDFNYKLVGCKKCGWRPLRVYNNGQQTFIQMGKGMPQGDAPVLLVIGNEGESLVNYRVIENRFIVDQVFDEAILVLGVGKSQDRLTIRRLL
jgi:type IV secretion system protein TrbG